MMTGAALVLAIAGIAIALASAVAYLRRGNAVDALLVVGCALAFALAQGAFTWPAAPLVLANATSPEAASALQLSVDGDGLTEARWRDLPARPLRWTAPSSPALTLDFPAAAPAGRPVRLQAQGSGMEIDRIELLAENGRPLAEGRGGIVQWVPLAVEQATLTARVFDRAGRMLAQGPVPIAVQAPQALRVQGRFGAPSFDVRVLEQLLTDSGAVLDWQVTLGRGISRTVAGATTDKAPDVVLADAAWIEHAGAGARRALLDQVAAGVPLLVLGGDAADPGFWRRELALAFDAGTAAPYVPVAGGAWHAGAVRTWSRTWEAGRITWLAAADWHRRAIADKAAVAAWMQEVLDAAGAQRRQEGVWRATDPMPLPGQRLEVCADDARGTVRVVELAQMLAWERRPDRAGGACVAVWPRTPGWMHLESGEARWAVYVYDPRDWPLWQAAQRRHATARYALRTPTLPPRRRVPIPPWPFILAAMLCALLLWWRERRK